jgi:hypothetical protein
MVPPEPRLATYIPGPRNEPSGNWSNTVAVSSPTPIATALLYRAFAEISTRDRTEVKLGVDALNPHGAVALYESVGTSVERRLDIFEWRTLDSAAHSER